ncbi:segregation and condensation protein A [Parvularcula dongshanensis]|uniref:Segregation and condensation protein A n=1 Tax=Parvularcula dongshanensis TaxID=1173995 RepID=A0A840I0B3_9PROT|nr:ScpA family protein [Parvularcula dongshanensis]MBB4657713.1 segregation and condensation protein A [Parvularcula dongshanensis]
MRPKEDDWEEGPARETAPEDDLVVTLNGYEGPLAVLLDLAQKQKVDLREVSVLALADQYLAFVEDARRRDLSLAADYLVMASWLTYLKSRLLLPEPQGEGDEPTGDEMAAQLAFQLQRLDAMRKAAEALTALPQAGRDVFPRGRRALKVRRETEWRAGLMDLLKAYSGVRVRTLPQVHARELPRVMTVEAARESLGRRLPGVTEWTSLAELSEGEGDLPASSIRASLFNAALEMAKAGTADMRQEGSFAPLYLRAHRD